MSCNYMFRCGVNGQQAALLHWRGAAESLQRNRAHPPPPKERTRSMCTATHTRDMQWCRGGVWLAGQRAPQILDTQTQHSISLSVCYWNEEWLITEPADTSAAWFLTDLWRPTCSHSSIPVLKLLVPCRGWIFGVSTTVREKKNSLYQGFNADAQCGSAWMDFLWFSGGFTKSHVWLL